MVGQKLNRRLDHTFISEWKLKDLCQRRSNFESSSSTDAILPLPENRRVYIYWVQSCMGFESNEKADELAKESNHLEQVAASNRPIPYKEVR